MRPNPRPIKSQRTSDIGLKSHQIRSYSFQAHFEGKSGEQGETNSFRRIAFEMVPLQ